MNYSSDLQSARLLLTTTSLMTDEAFAFIHSQCVFEGKLQNESLDEWQAQSFELAFVAARLGAASSLLSSALVSSGKNSTEDKRVEAKEGAANALSARVALTNVVRTLSGILGTLAAQAESLGLARERIFAFWQGEEFSQLEARYAGPKPLAALGEELLASGVTRLDPGLSEEQALMRSTFERFTQDIVAPRAEEIHRQDLDIPEEIISAAAQLGCFGTCIPERFGGLQSDDKPDSLSMIIVTEELSRGSLGAAGSLITRPEIAARALLAAGHGGTAAELAAAARGRRDTVCNFYHRAEYRLPMWLRCHCALLAVMAVGD
jgi:(2S)-methylsuccinyl-CoA dehydrogenase